MASSCGREPLSWAGFTARGDGLQITIRSQFDIRLSHGLLRSTRETFTPSALYSEASETQSEMVLRKVMLGMCVD
jgi:hypothetical protein